MKKIFLTLALVVCSMSAFSQFIQQGTFIDTNEYEERKVEVSVREGWEGSFLGAVGAAGYEVPSFVAFRVDGSYGYNVTPKFYLGTSLGGHLGEVMYATLSINPRFYLSKRLNAGFWDFEFGYILGSSEHDWGEQYGDEDIYRANGLYFGLAYGYRFNKWSIEVGVNAYDTDWWDDYHYEWDYYDEGLDPGVEFHLGFSFYF